MDAIIAQYAVRHVAIGPVNYIAEGELKMEIMTACEFEAVSNLIRNYLHNEATKEEKAQSQLDELWKERNEAEKKFRSQVWEIMKIMMPLTWKVVQPYMQCTEGMFSKKRAELRDVLDEPIEWWFSEFEMTLKDSFHKPSDRRWTKNKLGKVIMVW